MSQEIIVGDCLEVMKTYPDNHFTGIVTDPPYGLHFMDKDWDSYKRTNQSYSFEKEKRIISEACNAGRYAENRNDEYERFMFDSASAALRILKPGGHLLMFGAPRRYHRQICALEDAGFEIRDCIMWLFASGFPKSHNFGCRCDQNMLQLSHQKATESPTKSSMRCMSETDISSPIATCTPENEVLFQGMSQQDIQTYTSQSGQRTETRKESSVEGRDHIQEEQRQLHRPEICEMSNGISSDGAKGWVCDGTPTDNGETFEKSASKDRGSTSQRSQHEKQQYRKSRIVSRQQNPQDCGMATCEKCGHLKGWGQFGTSLKPAYEPIILAMKPLAGTFKENAEKWGVAGLNIDGCRIPTSDSYYYPTGPKGNGFHGGVGIEPDDSRNVAVESNPKGRWPANLILDDFNEHVLCLKNTIPNDIISVIQEYFYDYKLPYLSKRNKHISESDKKEQSSILQSTLLQSSIDRAEGAFTNCEADDDSFRNPRTPADDGDTSKSSSKKIRGGSSSQRGKRRQQNREFRNDGQLNSQNGTQGYFEGIENIEIGERTLKVLASDVPEKWLKYFEETGQEIRSPHCAAEMLDQQSGYSKSSPVFRKNVKSFNCYRPFNEFTWNGSHCNDSGGASRFFYCAKTSSRERNAGLDDQPDLFGGIKNDSGRGFSESDPNKPITYKNNHPTVKPLKLMEYLLKLIAPPKDALILDPFAGSGSTIVAAKKLGISAVGIEKQEDYANIAKARIAAA